MALFAGHCVCVCLSLSLLDTVCCVWDRQCVCVCLSLMCVPVVGLAPLVELAGAPGPVLRVEVCVGGDKVVTHAQGPPGEAPLPAGVPISQADAC